MLKAVDFTCQVCGIIIVDYIMRNDEDIPLCCKTKMLRLFTRPVYKPKHKEHQYPTNNIGSGDKARFGNKPNF